MKPQKASQQEAVVVCNEQASALNGLSKLSLFKMNIKGNASTDEDQYFTSFLTKLDATTNSSQFYFRKKVFKELLVWEVFSHKDNLNSWVTGNIRNSNFDYIIWPEGQFLPPKLLVFDMDSTFIQIEVIDELARRHGVGDSVSKVTEAAMRGELDFSESLISRVACLQGLAESTIADIASQLPLSEGVDKLVVQSKENSVKIAIVSGGFTPFVQHLKQTMGLFEVKANDLEINDGQLTGKVVGHIVDAQAKADFVNQLKEKLSISSNDIMTIGDGANDLLMMNESGFSLAYRAKPAVQAKAKGRMNFTYLNHLTDIFECNTP